MIRSTLFFSALVLSGTIAEPELVAHPSKPAVVAAPKTASVAGKREAPLKENRRAADGRGGPKERMPVDRVHFPDKERTEKRVREEHKEFHADGGHATFGRDGHVREVHVRGIEIHHGPEGMRQIRVERPDHSVLVARHGGYGYIQRSYSYHGHEFAHRTYFEHGMAYTRVYQPYYYRGISFHVYAPGYYYSPVFYGWAYNPWAAPVIWSWGWVGSPWHRYYGAWFTPYPVYSSPSLWLTDYLLAETLQSAYEARIEASTARRDLAVANLASTPITSDVKQAVAEEVRRQIALENAEARTVSQNPPDPGSSGLARMLSDHTTHVFVVSNGLNVISAAGECSITEGDVIQLTGQTAPNAVDANLMVLATKGNDCPKYSIVSVGLADLQEMQNHMRETIDQGLAELQSKQGKGGLPTAPAAAMKPPVQTEFAAIAPPPDPNAGADIKQQAAEADQLDQEVTRRTSAK
jgi:hypothetical protein